MASCEERRVLTNGHEVGPRADLLGLRHSRTPDHEAENCALSTLIGILSDDPQAMPQMLAETALDLCRADSAGISLAGPSGGRHASCWAGVAGRWAQYAGTRMAYNSGPWAAACERDQALIISYPERYSPGAEIDPPIAEILLVPIRHGGRTTGSIWVVSHDGGRQFDAEDARLLTSLSPFCGAMQRGEARPRMPASRPRPADEGVRRGEERYRVLFDAIDEGFCVIEMLPAADGRPLDFYFLESNPAFERHTGLTDAVGKRMRELAPGHEEYWFEAFDRVAETGESVRFVNRAGSLDGRWFDVHAFRIGDPSRRRVAILFSDITERRRLQRALRHRIRDLADADRRKDEFLAMLAHELRTPLAAIHGAVRVARRPGLEARIPEALEAIERQQGNLARLIGDLADVSRVAQGKLLLKRELVDVAGLLDRAAEAVRPLVEQKFHELVVEQAGVALRVDADPMRLEQVITNLLTNAAKYTEPEGMITLSARQQGGDVVIAVRDTGGGISPELLPRVFDLFMQADRSIALSQGGLGLGLTLVKRLVEAHGGDVAAASELGRGSEFTVRLPLVDETAGEDAPTPARCTVSGMRVLLVDDDVETALISGWLLRSMGFDVQVVHDGREALEAAPEFRPDLVLLDIALPGMDGYELAHRLRQDACCRSSLFIAISGYGDEQAREQSREAGFDHHLVKPVDLEAVLALVARDAGPPP